MGKIGKNQSYFILERKELVEDTRRTILPSLVFAYVNKDVMACVAILASHSYRANSEHCCYACFSPLFMCVLKYKEQVVRPAPWVGGGARTHDLQIHNLAL